MAHHPPALLSPQALTPTLHATWLQKFQELVTSSIAARRPRSQEAEDQTQQSPEPRPTDTGHQIRLRDWDLVRKDGELVCMLYLDKGQSWLGYDDFVNHPLHDSNRATVSIDECVVVHKALLNQPDILSAFPDDVQFEVGSAGEEPPLRTIDDFGAAVGFMTAIETWTKTSSRGRHVGRLLEVRPGANGDSEIILSKEDHGPSPTLPEMGAAGVTNSKVFLISGIRRAGVLLFDPRNFAKS